MKLNYLEKYIYGMGFMVVVAFWDRGCLCSRIYYVDQIGLKFKEISTILYLPGASIKSMHHHV